MRIYSIAQAEQVEIEKETRKKEPIISEIEKEKIYLHSDYEYSWIKQGARKGNWRLHTYRIAYLKNNLQAPYLDLSVYEHFGITDYTFDIGSYFKLQDGYLNGELGAGSDIDYIYKFKGLIGLERKLVDNLCFNLNGKYLHYKPQDVYIVSPGLTYYFGDNYVSAGYGASITKGRGSAHFGAIRGGIVINKYLSAWLGTTVGERLYDIFSLNASEQFGHILFLGVDINVRKNIRLSIGGSYSKEQPSFIKRSIYLGASTKF